MTWKKSLIGLVAVLAVVGALVAGPAVGADGPAVSELQDRIDQQTDATDSALTLATDPWTPRIAGLGAGLAVGLLAGGVAAYVGRGGDG
ncbi:sugar porter family MFS transporter [Halorussus halobius]|uniref:sugar porter family MFS transporter n=1 Tax=Halorussus halobius TaxID=1710537 RepID=UPI001091D4FD|nr:sugar porter family MFS transporter [Halorussus halobius]